MKLEKIKQILEYPVPEEEKEKLILLEIAKDKEAIPYILVILNQERKENTKLLLDSNLELSRALITIQDPKIGKRGAIIEKDFVIEEIKKHYLKWKDTIRCCFNIKGLP